MQQHEIATLFDYNYWASRRILAQVARLSAEQFGAQTSLSWGSIRGTLVHIMAAEWAWRSRCQGELPTALLDEADFPTLERLLERWAREERAMQEFIAGFNDDDLSADVYYLSTGGKPFHQPLWQILLHVVHHGTQHRSELAHVLTEFGHSPGDIDFILYLREV